MTIVSLSVHDMADQQNVTLTADQARVIANALILVSYDLALPVGLKKYKTTKDNPDYESQRLARRGMIVADEEKLPVLKKRISQSYNVKSFDPSLDYYFTQLCIVLNIRE